MTQKTLQQKLDDIVHYIQGHLDSDLNVDSVSARASLSKYHFHRAFCAHTGVNLAKYILLSRLKRASFQLAFQPEIKIIDIAFHASFESPEAFSRSFKRQFSQTPREFRASPNWPHWHQQFVFQPPKVTSMLDVKIVNTSDEKIAFISHKGNPNRVLETASRFIAWRKASGLSPIKTSRTYGIPWSDPEVAPSEAFRFDVCGSMLSDVPANEFGVKTGLIPGGRCAVVRHLGSHDNIKDSVYFLYKNWLPDSGEQTRDFPVYFQYLNFIHEVNECDLKTDIFLPIQ